MKAITLWQPWASLLACGAKKYETRSWTTKYRGEIAIHAAKKPIEKTLNEMFPRIEGVTAAEIEFIGAVREHLGDDDNFIYGAVIATAELVECHEIHRYGGRGITSKTPGWLEKGETEDEIYYPEGCELLFGDWSPGMYAWEFRNMKILDNPIPAKGGMRLWDWTKSEGRSDE